MVVLEHGLEFSHDGNTGCHVSPNVRVYYHWSSVLDAWVSMLQSCLLERRRDGKRITMTNPIYDLPVCKDLKPWRKDKTWKRDFWGVPYPVNELIYYRSNGKRVEPRDPSTIIGYNPLGTDGWPFYPGDVVRIEIRTATTVGHVNVATGELVQTSYPTDYASPPNGYVQRTKITTMYSSTKGMNDCPLYGTIVSRCKVETEFFDRFHVLVGEELFRFENIVKDKGKLVKLQESVYSRPITDRSIKFGSSNDRMVKERQVESCSFMFHLVIGSKTGDEERARREIVLLGEVNEDNHSTGEPERDGESLDGI